MGSTRIARSSSTMVSTEVRLRFPMACHVLLSRPAAQVSPSTSTLWIALNFLPRKFMWRLNPRLGHKVSDGASASFAAHITGMLKSSS